jgi:hypothetical protein
MVRRRGSGTAGECAAHADAPAAYGGDVEHIIGTGEVRK